MPKPETPESTPSHDAAAPFEAPRRGVGRRRFLRTAVGAGLGSVGLAAGVSAGEQAAKSDEPRIRKYVTLGRTGLKISDIGFGSGGCESPDVVRHCFDRGVTYYDTATMYRTGFFSGEFIENMIGEALHDKRDKVVITSKQVTKGDEGVGKLMFYLNASLKRLRTDYLDVYMNHAVNDVARLKHDAWWEFIDRAKQEGKIRFSGMSGHGGNLRECLDYAIDQDLVDVILAAYNFGSDPAFYESLTKNLDQIANQVGLPERLAKAKKKGIGVVVMKTLMGAKLNDLESFQWGGATHAQAAFRWVLSDPNVDALVVSMKNQKLVDEYLRASGQRGVGPEQARVLRRYVANEASEYCRPACNACESSCPAGVPIADVLRQRMYDLRYDLLEQAREGYARLGDAATACLSCSGAPCAGACPHGLDVSGLTRDTARRVG